MEEQQRRAYGKSQKPPSLSDLQRIIKALPRREEWESASDILSAAKLEEVTLPTRYEEIGAYFLTQNISQSVRDAIRRKTQAEKVPMIVWGTLPTGEVNAAAQKIGAENLVILNRGLFTFLYGTLLTSDRTISITEVEGNVSLNFSESEFHRAVSENSSLTNDFTRILVAFANRSDVPDIVFATNHEAPLVIRQLNSVERFIVAHEFGHVLSGDTQRGLRMLSLPEATGGGWRQVESSALDWSQELKADAIGIELGALARTRDESGSVSAQVPLFEVISAYAPILFLTIADALEDATFCNGSGQGTRDMLPKDVVERLVAKAQAARESNEAPSHDDADVKRLGCRLRSHPPAWLRAELIVSSVDKKFNRPPLRPSEDALLAKALISNTQALSRFVRNRVQSELISSAENRPGHTPP
ncbi:MAG: hypothetical protein M0R47_12520 [Methylobacter sp.]|uniref:hypothetical protein n=1 Tax=Methylobacter sp. TaxID=2051955 RepID=UPI0025DFF872|nr:hypothetical protein [Methylobacter sp.]MCK9621347.1 hypothetical protein [Methylobacter sp.]